MQKYSKKIQVLLTEEQFQDLTEIADQKKKKLGAIVREAIEAHYLKKANQRKVSKAVDNLLELPEMSVPENYQEWEAQYQKDKYPKL
jgi:predicted DNA-binding protein